MAENVKTAPAGVLFPSDQAFVGGEYGSSDLDTDALYEVLLRILPRNFRAYRIVLDGLDEYEESERQELIRVLKRLQGIFNVLICISVRPTFNQNGQ
jgi:hypothetical protein